MVYDEGSSENYKKRLETILKEIQTIDVLHYGNEAQTSLAQSRNEAIHRSNGRLIQLLDSDDFCIQILFLNAFWNFIII